MLDSRKVTIVAGEELGGYPNTPPFRPGEDYPELQSRVGSQNEPNSTYALVRELLLDMGLDAQRAGTSSWNPLADIIRPGHRVVIKPNLVRHFHERGGDFQCVVTHAAVVRAVADYVALALQGCGQIVVGDAPVQGTNFEAVVARTSLREVCEDVMECWDVPVRLADFRLWALESEGEGSSETGSELSGDPDGYCAVDFGDRSMLARTGFDTSRFRVTCYNADSMRAHHNDMRHEYLVAKAVLDADVVVNLPKLKTHRKVGLTAALKNLVGINGHKDWLPHHRVGSVADGGDEYQNPSSLKRLQTRMDENIYRQPGAAINRLRRLGTRVLGRLNRYLAQDPYYEGSWYGNDTCWRMVLDLNRLLRYADRDGYMTENVQRQTLTLVDAIVAGEGDGPMRPDPRKCNLLIGGTNPVAVDAVLATMIGFDYRRIALVAQAFEVRDWPLVNFAPNEVEVISKDERFADLRVGVPCSELCFVPPSSWVGHIEFPEIQINRTTPPYSTSYEGHEG